MSKNISNYKSQIKKLYMSTASEAISLGGASWVALLALRGFTLTEIGIIEAIFHIMSLCAEIPSGAVADVLGRKNTMVASRIMSVLSAVCMIMSESFWSVALAICVSALSYNLASGTREALAYDSLKYFNEEDKYNRFASNEMMIYRIGSGAATLLAGLALHLGYKKAYGIDVIIYLVAVIIAMTLTEYKVSASTERDNVFIEIRNCIRDSLAFLKQNHNAIRIIAINSLVGAIATLLLFFLQAKLPILGLNKALLGPALFIMSLGAALGAKLVQYCNRFSFNKIIILSCLGIILGILSLVLRSPYIVIIGGFIAAFADDFMEVRTDVVLNDMIPSEQRATLVSICSFSFSMVMIILSPLMGWLLDLL